MTNGDVKAEQHAIARTLVERLFEGSNCNIESSGNLFAGLSLFDEPSSDRVPSFCIRLRGVLEVIDVRYRGQGGLYTRLDQPRLRLWRQWNNSYPLTIIVVSPKDPYFQAISGPYIHGNRVPTKSIRVLEIDRWGIKPEVYEVCIRQLKDFLAVE